MSYSSPIFLFLFLPVALTAYLAVPSLRWRNAWLLVASLGFYAWGEGAYLGLLLLSIALNHGLGLWVERVRGTPAGRWAIVLTVALNLGMLGAFKYVGFFVDNLNALLVPLGFRELARPAIHLPVGLSFFTFQAMSYVLDIHMRGESAQRNPLHTALYVASFSQLVLGPIVRYRHIAAELTERVTTAEDFAIGARRFAAGLGKKVLIADTLALAVDGIYALPAAELTPGLAWLAAAGFMLQLYFDFSGYSDMAIGLGRMFGFHYRENFNYPLFAISRSDFFRRWNISFFTWMRDYLFIPLCGKRCPLWREQLNVMILFLLVGLWHGASWLFVIWGLANGLLIVLERVALLRWLHKAWRPAQHGYALLTTMVSLTFFRAGTLDQAWTMLRALAGDVEGSGARYTVETFLTGDVALALAVGALLSAPVVPALREWGARVVLPRLAAPRLSTAFAAQGIVARPAAAGFALALPGVAWMALLLAASAMAVAARTYTPFVYFQF